MFDEKYDEKYSYLYKKSENNEEGIRRLINLVKLLRVECPWDRKQTHESLEKCLIEETYELIEAIEIKDYENMKEEAGDVLLQVIMHSMLSEEEEKFNFLDVCNNECEKLIRRHPHIFLKENVKSIDKAVEKWENVKRSETFYTTHSDKLKSVPKALPALIRSYKIQKKAAEVGFDWDCVQDALQKIKEETEELELALRNTDSSNIVEELGDLLFATVNVSRFLKVEPEEALRKSCEKFIRRFQKVEEMAINRGENLEQLTLMEMDEFWNEVKLNEKAKN